VVLSSAVAGVANRALAIYEKFFWTAEHWSSWNDRVERLSVLLGALSGKPEAMIGAANHRKNEFGVAPSDRSVRPQLSLRQIRKKPREGLR